MEGMLMIFLSLNSREQTQNIRISNLLSSKNIIIVFHLWMSNVTWKNKLKFFVYRLRIFSKFFPGFKSFIPAVFKIGLVYTLLPRCFNISSSYEKLRNEINVLKQTFEFNGYLIQFIDIFIKQFPQKL